MGSVLIRVFYFWIAAFKMLRIHSERLCLAALAAAVVLLPSATVGIVATQGPPEQRVAKQKRSLNAKETEQHKQNQEAAGKIMPSVAKHPSANMSDTETAKSSEDIDIQRNLVKFTKWLAIVGALQFGALVVQAVVFYFTLRQLRDTAAAEKVSLIQLNRAYLTVDNWMVDKHAPGKIDIRFRIFNPSGTATRIEIVEYTIRTETIPLTYGRMLTPKEAYWVRLQTEIKDGEAVQITGRITYRDIFHMERHRKFATNCVCDSRTPWVIAFFKAEGPGLNDEEEWDKEE